MYAEVHHTEQLSPDLLRVVLTGGTLEHFDTNGATDAYINARFPPEGSQVVVPFETDDLESVPEAMRPRPRRFTVRQWDAEARHLSIDFVVHGDVGYAGRWAQRAKPGDRLQFQGPGGSYRPSTDVDWHLLVGDESAFGAIGASLESLQADAHAEVFVIAEQPGCEIDFPSDANVVLHWLYRSEVNHTDSWVADRLADSTFPAGTYDVFVHGEAAEVRAVRQHLAEDRGIDTRGASISPYWRRKHTDEDWRKIKGEFMSSRV